MAMNWSLFPHEVRLRCTVDDIETFVDERRCWAAAEFGNPANFRIDDVKNDEVLRVYGTLLRDGPWLNFSETFLFKDERQAALFRVFWG